jgi:hypothetical protein
VAYYFPTKNNKIKLLMEYENVTQKVLSGNAVLAALMSETKYDIPQNGVLWFFATKATSLQNSYGKDPLSDNAI